MLNKSRGQRAGGRRERSALSPSFVQEHAVILSEVRFGGRSRRVCGCISAEQIFPAAHSRKETAR